MRYRIVAKTAFFKVEKMRANLNDNGKSLLVDKGDGEDAEESKVPVKAGIFSLMLMKMVM